ncbi:hypothetical protein [Helicobacter pullorum]|nr:hypothetical protein [Helicobacter pullorum]
MFFRKMLLVPLFASFAFAEIGGAYLDRSQLYDTIFSGCKANTKSFMEGLGITDEKISNYCECLTTSSLREFSNEELRLMIAIEEGSIEDDDIDLSMLEDIASRYEYQAGKCSKYLE